MFPLVLSKHLFNFPNRESESEMLVRVNVVERNTCTYSLYWRTFYNVVEDNCTKNWTYKPHLKLYYGRYAPWKKTLSYSLIMLLKARLGESIGSF